MNHDFRRLLERGTVGRLSAGMVLKKALVNMTLMAIGFAGVGFAYCAVASGSREAGAGPQAAAAQSAAPRDRDAPVVQLRNETRSVLEKALASVRTVEDLEQRVWLLCEIARLQARAGLADALEGTLKTAIEAAQETESEHRLIDVAEALARAGDVKTAVELVDPLALNRDYGLNHVAAVMAGAGDVNGALRVAGTIRNENSRSEALQRIAIAQAEGGDMKGAQTTVAKISDAAALAEVLTAIAARQYRTKDPAAAQSLEHARRAADTIPPFVGDRHEPTDSRASALAAIAGVLAGSGATEEARKVAAEIAKAPWDDIARRNIAAAQAGRGEIEAALQTAENIHGAYEKGEALNDVVIAQVAANDHDAARTLASRIEPGRWRVDALLAIAKGQYRSGRRKEALEIFQAARREADLLVDGPRVGNAKPAALGHLASAQAEVGEEKAALAWIDDLASPLAKAWSLGGLAEGLAGRLPASPPPKIRILVSTPQVAEPAAEHAPKPITTFRGKIVLFGTRRAVGGEAQRIEMINPDGTGLETILTLDEGQAIHAGRVSPDGKRLAFSASQAGTRRPDLWSVTTDRVRRKIADDILVVAWSPDGRRLAAIRDTDPNTPGRENLILDVETGHEQRLPIPETDAVEDWSPDGATLIVMAANVDKVFEHPTKGAYPLRQIYLMHPDGTGRAPLTSRPLADNLDARFSPDGSRVTYFQRRHPDNLVLHFAVVQGRGGADARDLAQFNEIYKGNRHYKPNGPPCWSPDGKSVAWFIPRRKLDSSSMRIELLILSVETGQANRLDLHQRGLEWVQTLDWR
ncbi:MAG: hypothetical protein P4L85_25390 [Paludisphaera borealis]|uniref:hypothetical protein n=1 Tax=Paludisphaera borealis TaxID=1387353 RepID=UPI0028516DAD|nr:hypothetical protein [Paludisphaera borealis]MDR3622712.1 hypothetical protein [Paludisphaera borealis]